MREQLDYLQSLGVTAIELMPVHDFPGERNWGYDPAALFAPARPYGTPDALRRLVDAAWSDDLLDRLRARARREGMSLEE